MLAEILVMKFNKQGVLESYIRIKYHGLKAVESLI